MSGSFWGLVVEPGNKYTQTVEDGFNVCSAALGSDAKAGNTTLYARVEESEIALCTLNKDKWPQYGLNLPFAEGTEMSFYVKGENSVYLSGFTDQEEDEEIDPSMYDPRMIKMMKEQGLIPADDAEGESGDDEDEESMDSDMMEELLGESEDEEEESEEDEEPKVTEIKETKSSKAAKRAAEEAIKQTTKKQKQEEKKAAPTKKEAPAKKEVPKKEQAQKKAKQVKLPGGTIVEDIKVGTGPIAKNGKNIGMHYVGRLASNNKVFDQNTSGKPFRFRMGLNEVIKGWDQGLQGMQVGGKRVLRIPPSQGYGTRGHPPVIPGNSTLVFECELVYVK
eukprot:CFRG0261T1